MKLSDLVGFLSDESAYDVLYRGHKVKYLNEAGIPSDSSVFYVAGFEFGAHVLVHVKAHRRDGFGAAWEVWIDDSATIPVEELVEALRPESDSDSFLDLARDAMREGPKWGSPEWEPWHLAMHAKAKALLAECECPELVEGYEYQSNASGTGIVSVGHYAWMNEADLDEVEIVPREKT